MAPYNNTHQGQQENSDSPVDPKQVAVLLVLFVAIVLFLCLCSHLGSGTEEQEQDTDDERRRRQWCLPQLRSLPPPPGRNAAGGWDRAPSPVATVVEVAPAPMMSVSPLLVCTYSRTDGWREGSCGVCLADLADGEAVGVLPACLHYFHAACVGEWLRRHHSCPLCRARVSPAGGAMCVDL